MSMTKPIHMVTFEAKTGMDVDKAVRDENGDYHFYVTYEVGGYDADSEEFYQLVLDGPAQGERAYL